MADALKYSLDIQFETLKELKKELKLAKQGFDILGTGTEEFAQKERNIQLIKNRITEVTTETKRLLSEINRAAKTDLPVFGSLDYLNKQIQGYTALKNSVATTSQEFLNYSKILSGLRAQQLTVHANMQKTQTASSNASMALLNLNYVIRDSPYFFQNFALGILAVGNNINPLIDSFARLRMEAGDKSITTFQLLKQALVGGAGISIAFSLVVTAIQSFVFWNARANRGAKETKEAVDTLTNALNRLASVESPLDKIKYTFDPKRLYEGIDRVKADILDIEKRQDIVTPSGEKIRVPFETTKKQAERVKVARVMTLEQRSNAQSRLDQVNADIKELQQKQATLKVLEDMREAYEATYEASKLLSEAGGKPTTPGEKKQKDQELESIKNLVSEKKALLDNDKITNEEYYKFLGETYRKYNNDFKMQSLERLQFFGGLNNEIRKHYEDNFKLADENYKKQLQIYKLEKEAQDEANRNFQKFLDDRTQKRKSFDLESELAGMSPGERIRAERRFGLEQKYGEVATPEEISQLELLLDKQKAMAENERDLISLTNQVGSSLVNAFMQGKFAIEDFLKSLAAAIMQMLLLRGISAAFSGGMPTPTSFGTPVGGDGLNLTKYLSPGVYGESMSGSQSINININGSLEASTDKIAAVIGKSQYKLLSSRGVASVVS